HCSASGGGRRASMHCTLNTQDRRRRIPMNRLVPRIALTAVIAVGTQAHAVDSTSQSTTSKYQTIAQLVGCMRKRMSANKGRSYNEAMKACKDQNKESDHLPSGALVASDIPAKP